METNNEASQTRRHKDIYYIQDWRVDIELIGLTRYFTVYLYNS